MNKLEHIINVPCSWISVDDVLPDTDAEYWVHDAKRNKYSVKRFWIFDDYTDWQVGYNEHFTVTHYQPIHPPKKNDNESK